MTDIELDNLKKLIDNLYKGLEKLSLHVQKLETSHKKEKYRNIPGEEGDFNGEALVSADGKTIEVPANYAAKSRLVFGDHLKVIIEDGKRIFKQIEKVSRVSLEGVASKKEGRWYVLTDKGTFKISDVAAEFNNLKLNDRLVVLLPENNSTVTFATLDKVIVDKEEEKGIKEVSVKNSALRSAPEVKEPILEKKKEPVVRTEAIKDLPKVEKKSAVKKKEPTKIQMTPQKQPEKKEFVADISQTLDEDDLR